MVETTGYEIAFHGDKNGTVQPMLPFGVLKEKHLRKDTFLKATIVNSPTRK